MLFNSLEFLIFLPTVFLLYWFVFQKNLKVQNSLLLISSYVFYGWWDYRFLSLIFLSTVVDYFVGLKIDGSNDKKIRKSYLWVSILFNLGLLGFFKYFNFFIDSWIDLIGVIGYEQKSTWTLNVILPVGISFYTFQTMSYSLDIYYGKLKPTKDFISFASFVSFFPQLVAGPIERASNLLPQILTNRIFKYEQGVQGLRLILYGMFKKVVIADSLALHVDTIFANYTTLNGGVLLLGLIYFSFQIYCDFSGYSDIAIGISKLFGFELMLNFKFPFFSRDIGEFWRRWHISLSTWFKDYVYMPLLIRFRDYKTFGVIIVTIITYLIIGLWHGADYKYLAFGLIQGILFIPIIVLKKTEPKYDYMQSNNRLQNIYDTFKVIKTFLYFSFSLCFFRSESINDGIFYLLRMVSIDNFGISIYGKNFIPIFISFLILEIVLKNSNTYFSNIQSKSLRYFIYLYLLIAIFSNTTNQQTFIYFQF